ncbi:hypothetical protein ALC60_08736 [Trachymyrmex zeteki]|uniref:Uncharacterized protein n=1 Tax=Mycetomoellerius zeteki TaxID=64791 RepID=A0A151WW40_9HYME|nr:hypothetical protein ALC60_08736 [Trachymyrmex zeteki]
MMTKNLPQSTGVNVPEVKAMEVQELIFFVYPRFRKRNKDGRTRITIITPTSTTRHSIIVGLQHEDDNTKKMVVKVSDVTARRFQLDIMVD